MKNLGLAFGDANPAPAKATPVRPPNVLRLPANRIGRDWFVGDIHGEADLLQRFLDKVDFNIEKDRLIAVGDLIDRGPHPERVLEMFGAGQTWFYSALGNHDAMMRESLLFDDYFSTKAWLKNGNQWALKLSLAERARLAHYLLRMPLAIEVPMRNGRIVGVVHAEIPAWSYWDEIKRYSVKGNEASEMGDVKGTQIIWGRSRVKAAMALRASETLSEGAAPRRGNRPELLKPVSGIDLVVMGHTPLEPAIPLKAANMLWMDTGAGYKNGRLTFADLRAGEYVQFTHGRKRSSLVAIPEAF